jgi:Flp pilus assembly secretin CpaC
MMHWPNSRVRYAVLLIAGLGLRPQWALAQDQDPVPFQMSISPAVTESAVLPHQFLSVSTVSAQMQVTQHYSRVLKTRSSVTRTFVADPRIAEVVQFGPNELALIGVGRGSTTLTLWFDEASEPLVMQVESLGNPANFEAPMAIGQKGESGRSGIMQTGKQERQRPNTAAAVRSPQVVSTAAVPSAQRPAKNHPPVQRTMAPAPQARYDGHASWPANSGAPGRTARPIVNPSASNPRAPEDG